MLHTLTDERDGLLTTMERSRSNFPRRTYMCIKVLAQILREYVLRFFCCLSRISPFTHSLSLSLSRSELASRFVQDNESIRQRWSRCIDWLQEELEHKPFGYNHSSSQGQSWTSPAHCSNETPSGYALDRSVSACNLLEETKRWIGVDEVRYRCSKCQGRVL